jgi:hypothetical protein
MHHILVEGAATDRFAAGLQDGSVVEGGGRRGSGLGRWWYVEAAASVSHAAMVLWGRVVA